MSPDKRKAAEAAITPVQQMIASCSGAIATSLLVTPLDVVKIRLQTQQKQLIKGSCFLYCNGLMDHLCVCENGPAAAASAVRTESQMKKWYARPSGHFNGTLDAFVKIAKVEGISSLWSGLPPTLLMSAPATICYFTAYDNLKYQMGYQEFDPSTRNIPIVAGILARIGAATLISPIELVRTKMQSEQLTYKEVGKAVKISIKHGGFVSLMRGLGPTLLRDVPFSGIYWFGYEYMKAGQMQKTGSSQLNFSQSFLTGATAGTFAAVLTLPFDVVKTHRQIELGEAMVQHKKVPTTYQTIIRIYRSSGVGGLFAGIVPRVVKVAPACAIMISTYEYGKSFFRTYNAKKAMDNNRDL